MAVKVTAPALGLVVLIAVAHKQLLAWRSLLGLVMIAILFVPIKRYTLPGGLPFNLELYRLLVAIAFVGWLMSILVDPRVRIRASGLETPLFAFLLAVALSMIANKTRIDSTGSVPFKQLSFLLSYVLVFYLVVSVARRPRDLDFLVRILTGGGAVLAASAILESGTGYNVFNHMHAAVPFMRFHADQISPCTAAGACASTPLRSIRSPSARPSRS